MKRLLLVAAAAALAFSAGAVGASGHTVDLTTGHLDGHAILGRTVTGATAALGRPNFRPGSRQTYTLGWGTRPNFSVEVRFRPVGGVERAWSMSCGRDVRNVKIGDLLGRSSASLQAAILKGYPSTFTLVQPYRCRDRICSGDFVERSGPLHLTFGTQPKLGTWLNVYRTARS